MDNTTKCFFVIKEALEELHDQEQKDVDLICEQMRQISKLETTSEMAKIALEKCLKQFWETTPYDTEYEQLITRTEMEAAIAAIKRTE